MGQKSGCVCPGHWAHKREHFVVTRRNVATIDGKVVVSAHSEVKCMQCYKKWRSNAKYVEKLPDHEERHRGPLSDAEILELVRDERIVVDFETGEVWKERKINKTWMGELILLSARTNRGDRWESDRPRGDPYLFVTICDSQNRKEIALAKLVWMAFNDQVVPEGFDVDHFDRDKENNSIGNLRLLESSHNRSDNGDDEREWDEDDF